MARNATSKRKGNRRPGKTSDEGPFAGIAASDLKALLMSVARLPADPDDEALDLAQEKAFEAMEAPTPRARAALARAALALSPRCADAYLVLARETRDDGEALDLYRRAVAAGAEALGKAAFEDDVGMFWGLIETRPYMRARHELALALWRAGNFDEAIGHYQEMLRLNPNDNQGVRYLLIDALLERGRDAEAAALLKAYKGDGAAAWAWSGALLAFRRSGGASAAARKALAKAIEANRHVPAYLLGRKPLPQRLPDFIGRGDVSEAASYAFDAAGAWAAAAGATAWVAEALASPFPAEDRRRAAEPEPEPDLDRIDEAVLALLLLGLHDERRVWKGFDWSALDRLHAKGFISNPAGRAKSVTLSDEGLSEARRLHRVLFSKRPADRR
jgi:tetratricopeptide (TPR) repeat protein